MADTPILKLPQVAPGQNQKETTINAALAILEAAMNDSLIHTGKTASFALTEDQWTRYFLHRVQGNTTSITMTVPARERLFVVSNEGTANLIVTPAGGTIGNSAEIPFGKIVLLVNDGVNVYAISSGVSTLQDLTDVDGTGATDTQVLSYDAVAEQWVPITIANLFNLDFTGLGDVPANYTGAGSKLLRVKATTDGIEFFVPSLTTLSDVNPTLAPEENDVLTYVGGQWIAVPVGAASIEFKDLIDAPAAYTGQSGKLVAVKATEDGVEFVDPASAGATTFTALTDTPAAYTGHAGKLVAVNGAADGLEFIAAPVNLAVEDESISVVAATTKLNFQGAGVSVALGGAGEAVVTIDGSGGGSGGLGAHSYWRVRTYSAVSENYASAAEVEFRATVGGADQATGGTAISSSQFTGSEAPSFAFDGNAATMWESAVGDLASGDGAWVGYQFAAPVDVIEVSYQASTFPNEAPKRAVIEFSDDGTIWTKAWAIREQAAWTSNETRVFQYDDRIDLFLDLDDAPDTYIGHTSKVVAVKSDGSGLEFINKIDTFLELTDTPSSYTSQGGKTVKVNSGGTALEFVDVTPGDPITVTNKTASYTLALTDAGDLLTFDAAAGVEVTLPPDADVALPIGTQVSLVTLGVGQLTVTPGVAVTLRTPTGMNPASRAQYCSMMVVKIAANVWVLMGDLETTP